MGTWSDSPRITVKDGFHAGRAGWINWQEGTRMSVYLPATDTEREVATVLPLKLVELDTPAPTSAMASARAAVVSAHRSGGAHS